MVSSLWCRWFQFNSHLKIKKARITNFQNQCPTHIMSIRSFKWPGLQQQPRCITLADAAPGVDDGLVDLQPGAGFDAAVGPEEAAAHGTSWLRFFRAESLGWWKNGAHNRTKQQKGEYGYLSMNIIYGLSSDVFEDWRLVIGCDWCGVVTALAAFARQTALSISKRRSPLFSLQHCKLEPQAGRHRKIKSVAEGFPVGWEGQGPMFSTMLRITLGSDEKCKHQQTSKAIRKKEMEDRLRVVQRMIREKDDFKFALLIGFVLIDPECQRWISFVDVHTKWFNASHNPSSQLSISFTVNPAEHLLLSTWPWACQGPSGKDSALSTCNIASFSWTKQNPNLRTFAKHIRAEII